MVFHGELIMNSHRHIVKAVSFRFYPRDAMLARALAIWPCVCVCLSVTSRCSIEMDGRIELVFGTHAYSHLS